MTNDVDLAFAAAERAGTLPARVPPRSRRPAGSLRRGQRIGGKQKPAIDNDRSALTSGEYLTPGTRFGGRLATHSRLSSIGLPFSVEWLRGHT
jgi:hypothetical protein